MKSQPSNSTNQIFVPHLLEQDLVTCYAQLRPFRQGGPRIQTEPMQAKTIIHNYGHGGAGVSLAPSTAHQAINLAANLLSTASQVAIIGSGIVGLLNAYLLIQRFSKLPLTIYAQQIPKWGNKNNDDLITSEVAPGQWFPFDYGLKDMELHNKLSNYAYAWYHHLSKTQKFRDIVRQVEVYSLSDTGEFEDESKLTEDLRKTSRWVNVKLNGKTQIRAHLMKTIKIDLQQFLHLIIQELKSQHVKFITKRLTLESLRELKEQVIFNCSGLGSRELFGDTKMKGLKGYILEYKNRDPQKYDCFLQVTLDGKYLDYYMHASRILIGRVVQHNETKTINQETVQGLLNLHQKFLQRYGLKQIAAKL